MSKYELAEAGARLPELVERARKGEGVVITANGSPVAEVRSLAGASGARRPTSEDIEWLRARRVVPHREIDSSDDVSQMRDEDAH